VYHQKGPDWPQDDEEENMRKAWLKCIAPLVALVLIVSSAACQETPVARPKNVIVMIGDGMGPAAVTLTRLVSGKDSLVHDEYLIGMRRTSSQDKIVTDSAAAATAMATGKLTKNDYLGVTSSGQPLGTVLEAAKFQKRMATGLVVKSRITHATPGGFSAHVMDRDDEQRIAVHQLGLRVDLMFGGGRDRFLPKTVGGGRKDDRNLLAEARETGYQVITTSEALAGDLRLPVMGLFNDGALHYDIDRATTKEPSLEEMTRKALQLLSQREEGFFLMIEGSEIDHTAHANDGGALVPEVLGYEAAFAAAIEFAKHDGRTLVVSTADHETGGLAITGGDRSSVTSGPRRLKANRVSTDAMVTMITEGKALEDVLLEYANVKNVTDEEKAAYEAATPGKESELQKRRILVLGKIISSRANIKWACPDHSGVDVSVYAYGPGQELFRGSRPATWMATAVAQLLGLDLEEATREARERIKGDVGKPGE
jgi:alkaline phosphatase